MPNKFSVIVAVYNTEKYLRKCLDSLINQTYGNFEIIVVNDGSPDNSQIIIDEYAEKYPDKIVSLLKENGGLSDARNCGITRASGDYLLFVDSDDYLDSELLEALNCAIEKNQADIVRFSAQIVFEDSGKGEILSAPEVSTINGEEAINLLIDNKQYFEPAPFYAYKRSYWEEKGFSFKKGRYHEDYGLIPEVIMRSASFCSILHIGYFYVQSSNSIMRNASYEKSVAKANDVLFHSFNHINLAKEIIVSEKIRAKFCSYIANALIGQIEILKGNDRKAYIKTLKKEKVFNMLLADNLKRRLKRIYFKLKFGAF